jgi:hypothetical protein
MKTLRTLISSIKGRDTRLEDGFMKRLGRLDRDIATTGTSFVLFKNRQSRRAA